MGDTKDAWIENRRHVKGYPHHRSAHIRRSVLRQLERRCRVCGEADEGVLAVHHVNGDSLDNRLENLQVLCRPCHRDETPAGSGFWSFLDYDASR